jgi:hypothetical protein
MIEGRDQDDMWRMVEDEFLDVARLFTKVQSSIAFQTGSD